MILIDDILISDEVVEKKFACDLSACKGACCVEGDYGAPLEADEVLTIASILPDIMPYLPELSQQTITEDGFHTYNEEAETSETALMEDGACVFMGRNEIGITYCGIEKAHRAGAIDYKKPISCHLYPIRVKKNKVSGFQALNYDRWDICNPACKRGKKESIRVFEFARDAVIRKYGEDFYDALAAAADRDGKE